MIRPTVTLRSHAALLLLCCAGVSHLPANSEQSPAATASPSSMPAEHASWTDVADGVRYRELRTGQGTPVCSHARAYVFLRIFDAATGELMLDGTHEGRSLILGELVASPTGETLESSYQLAMLGMTEGGQRLVLVRADQMATNTFELKPADLLVEVTLIWVRSPDPKRVSRDRPHPSSGAAEGEASAPASAEAPAGPHPQAPGNLPAPTLGD